MAFLEDPRLRQRWNQISHNAGEVTENAAAGIWSFQHHYINPCLASLAASLEQCANPCLGDREERARRRRERDRAGGRAEYSFDFYDDWYAEDQDGGFLGGWGNDDWDRLLAGTGSQQKNNTGGGDVQQDQPKRKRGMSYGTRGRGSKALESDPTVIPSTQPIGFLGKLPWKLGKTLRYKPSAADLQDHPRQHGEMGMGETEPLLTHDSDDDDDDDGHDDVFQSRIAKTRNRSGTTGSGVSSDSYRSRGDLFPSDGEGEEDAVPFDDEFMVLDKVRDDRSSSRTKASKGKRRADGRPMSRTVSRATIDSSHSMLSPSVRRSSTSGPTTPDTPVAPSMEASMEELQREEERIRREEDDEVERKRQAALQLASERGLHDAGDEPTSEEPASEADYAKADEVDYVSDSPSQRSPPRSTHGDDDAPVIRSTTQEQYIRTEEFVPARLPSFR